jgi:hypothetical protein
MAAMQKAKLYKKYPAANIFIYNGLTVLHFALGGIGIIVGYGFWGWLGYLLGIIYLAFAFGGMYLVMPLAVCPRCVYYRLEEGLCISGLNRVSRGLARAGNAADFARRAQGVFCPNNLYVASLVIPIVLLIPALIWNFSWSLLIILVVILGLLVFRFFVVFPKLACIAWPSSNVRKPARWGCGMCNRRHGVCCRVA